MKRTSFIAVLTAIFVGLLYTTSFAMSFNPASDLSWWDDYQWKPNNPVTITHTGSSVSFVVDGTKGDVWGEIYKTYPASIGILAEVSVSAVMGHAQIGIRKYIAKQIQGTGF